MFLSIHLHSIVYLYGMFTIYDCISVFKVHVEIVRIRPRDKMDPDSDPIPVKVRWLFQKRIRIQIRYPDQPVSRSAAVTVCMCKPPLKM